jgi:hypothetical protein
MITESAQRTDLSFGFGIEIGMTHDSGFSLCEIIEVTILGCSTIVHASHYRSADKPNATAAGM